jgi:hypothetical protein
VCAVSTTHQRARDSSSSSSGEDDDVVTVVAVVAAAAATATTLVVIDVGAVFGALGVVISAAPTPSRSVSMCAPNSDTGIAGNNLQT